MRSVPLTPTGRILFFSYHSIGYHGTRTTATVASCQGLCWDAPVIGVSGVNCILFNRFWRLALELNTEKHCYNYSYYKLNNLITNTTSRMPNTIPERNMPFVTNLLLLCLPMIRFNAICNTITKSSLSKITKPVTGVPLGMPYSSSRYSNCTITKTIPEKTIRLTKTISTGSALFTCFSLI